jgi:hypothetical protein
MWSLTNIATMQRDKATRALYYFGRRELKYFLKLVDYSFEINDPYVGERMLAALYGVCMGKTL